MRIDSDRHLYHYNSLIGHNISTVHISDIQNIMVDINLKTGTHTRNSYLFINLFLNKTNVDIGPCRQLDTL